FCLIVLIVDVHSLLRRARRNAKVIPIRRSKGFTLIELLIVCAIILILASISLPNVPAMIRAWNNQQAYQRVKTVSNAQAALAVCYANHQTCPGVAPLIPQSGSITTTTYTLIYNESVWDSGSWWSYTAIPLDHLGRSFFVDSTGIVR